MFTAISTEATSVSAPRRHTFIAPGAGESYWILGDINTLKLGAAQTGGRFSLWEAIIAPGGGPPPHVHRREDELFYVLGGEFSFIRGDHMQRGTRGSCFHLPKGIPHTFKNVGDHPGRLLVASPPAGFERFFVEIGVPCPDPAAAVAPPPVTKADIDRLLAACPRYGAEMRFDHRPTGGPAPAPTTDQPLWVLGQHVNLKLTSADTGGQFTVAEVTAPPGGPGVPRHAHAREDEVFYVLEGTVEFTFDDGPVTTGPGTIVHVPAGTMHGFRNAGTSAARLLDYHAPGGFEAFYLDCGVPVLLPDETPPPPPAPDALPDIVDIIRRHGMDVPKPA